MRRALSCLTVRGRAFLAAGITTVVAAWLVGQGSIVRLGVLAAVLPLLSAAFVARSRQDLVLNRTLTPAQVTVGQPAAVELALTNVSRTPTGVLLGEETLPYVLGTRPRFVLEGLPTGGVRRATYTVRSDVRGRHQLGPLQLRVTDPFGLVELSRSFHQSAPLTVTPRVVPLPGVQLGGAWTGSGDNRPRAFATGSAEDVMVRDYRRGDDLRRVHWRSSARVGELMVRREEQPWQSRATVFVDNRLASHRGTGAASSLEAAVTAAASVAVHLVGAGFNVRLVTASGVGPAAPWHTLNQASGATALLDELAVLEASAAPHPDTRWLAEPGSGGLLVGIFGDVVDTDLPFLRRLAHHGGQTGQCAALQIRAQDWGPDQTSGADAAVLLATSGWRVSTLGARDRLDVAWQELGRQAARGGVVR